MEDALGTKGSVALFAHQNLATSQLWFLFLIDFFGIGITALPPASFRGASAKTSFLLVSTSEHPLPQTLPQRFLGRCFREQRSKSYVGPPGASARASARAQREARLGNHPERSQELVPYLSIGRQAQKTVAHLSSKGKIACEP